MPKINSMEKNEEYCVLYTESKGYYLSKIQIAKSMKLENILAGTKKSCRIFIENKNKEIQIQA